MIEAHKITSLEGHTLESAVKNDFNLEINNSERVLKGYSSQVYKAKLGNEFVFIRINKDPNVFDVEKIGYQILEEHGIPVPRIIAYNKNPISIGLPTVIMTEAQGKTMGELETSPKEKEIIYEHVGELLKKIHQTKLKGFGQLKIENNELIGKFSSWKEYWDSQDEHNKRALDYIIDNKFITLEEAEKIKNIHEEIKKLDFEKSSLLHKDIHQGHFFVEGTDITGVIDLGSIMAGDPRYDIAMSLVFTPEPFQEYLKNGYGDLAYDPMVNKYMITIATRKIFFRTKERTQGNINPLLMVLKKGFDGI